MGTAGPVGTPEDDELNELGVEGSLDESATAGVEGIQLLDNCEGPGVIGGSIGV